jgi:hypothetical protein
MKSIAISLALVSAWTAVATSSPGIICREDLRMNNGPLREIILSPDHQGGYLLQSQFIRSLNSPEVIIEDWAKNLNCRIDEKSTLAYCQNQPGQSVVQVKERREVFYDSLEEDAKKKTNKYIDISVNENGVEKNHISFAASHCQSFGGEA